MGFDANDYVAKTWTDQARPILKDVQGAVTGLPSNMAIGVLLAVVMSILCRQEKSKFRAMRMSQRLMEGLTEQIRQNYGTYRKALDDES